MKTELSIAVKLIATYWDDAWRWLRRRKVIRKSTEAKMKHSIFMVLVLGLLAGCTTAGKDWLIDVVDDWAGYENNNNNNEVAQ